MFHRVVFSLSVGEQVLAGPLLAVEGTAGHVRHRDDARRQLDAVPRAARVRPVGFRVDAARRLLFWGGFNKQTSGCGL